MIRERIEDYYSEQWKLFQDVAAGTGYYNLGYAPRGFRGQFNTTQAMMVDLVARQFAPRPDMILADIGCGLGGPARHIAKRTSAQIIRLDLLAPHLQAHEDGAVRVQASASDLPFEDNSLDGVYSIESAFHYEHKQQFVRETARVLKPNGRLAIADIVMNEGYEDHWTHSGFKRALAAPELFTVNRYYEAGKAAGLTPLHCFDLTPGVMRALGFAAKHLAPRLPSLARKGYPVPWLLLVLVTFMHLKYTYPLIPAKYRLFVFEK